MGPIPSVSERRIPKMLSAWHGRMDRHIRLNVERGTFPVVVVAGKIANAAFAQLPIGEPLATIDVCGFLIPRCLSFVALLHIPHPCSHLHHACSGTARIVSVRVLINWCVAAEPSRN